MSLEEKRMESILYLGLDDGGVVTLRKGQGKSWKTENHALKNWAVTEVAVVLGCSVPAAKQRSARAVKRLRREAPPPVPQEARPGSRAIQEGGDG